MALASGTRLGSYEVLAQIGAGGMGEVYQAHDTKLGRDVAIKVLPSAFVHDPDRLSRFQREAKMLAALNHPNIATIFGLEQSDGVNYLVMELVPGQTLAERVGAGALKIEEGLKLGVQIAEALEAAHERGVIHRDLKPANVKVTPEGRVKVLDFGLAKAFEGDGGLDLSNAPTLTAMGTEEGKILGTPAYMSPEQARGKAVDKRTDIWAFGCVLYELLTGKVAFRGETISDTLAAVLEREPDLQKLPPATPAKIRDLLRRCLQKDFQRRLRDIGDARIEIEETLAAPQPQRKRRWLPWAVAAAVMTVAAAGVAGYFLTRPAAPALTSQFTVDLPPETNFSNPFAATAISPDGRFLVYGAVAGSAMPTLWLRPFDSLAVRSLPGTEGANLPFWSPDSKSIAFFAGGKLKRVDVVGGAPLVLCDAATADNASVGGAWSRDGVILFGAPDGLRRVPASGGVPVLLTKANASAQELGNGYPQFLPDGKRFLYFVQSGNSNTQGIYASSLDRPQDRVQILRTSAKALYAPPVAGHPGYLLWLRENTLLAQRFDAGNLRPEGDPAPLAEDIALNGYRAAFWTSDAGLLVFRTDVNSHKAKLVWIGRDGKRLGNAGPEDDYTGLQLSPDGKRVALGREDPTGNEDIWLLEFGRGVFTRFTFDPKRDAWPVWSPDGRQIAFNSDRSGFVQLYRKDSAGAGQEEQLTNGPNNKYLSDWSRDGRYLLYDEHLGPKMGSQIMALPLEGEHKPMVVLQAPFYAADGVFSPDGKWIAYLSDESDQDEVYVRAFSPAAAAAGSKWQVSNQGGTRPKWRSDGKELFYLAEARITLSTSTSMMAADIRMRAASVEIDTPRELFPISVDETARPYDVTPDGQRFLVEEASTTAARSGSLTVVTNWQAGLK